MKLIEILKQYDEDSLRFYARDWGVSSSNDEEQLTKLNEVLIQEGILKRLGVLDQAEFDLLNAVEQNQEIPEEENERLEKLLQFDLIYLNDDEVSWIEEVREIYLSIKDDLLFQQRREKKSWFIKVQQVLVHYWGESSLEQLEPILGYSKEELVCLLPEIPLSELVTTLKAENIQWRSFPRSVLFREYQRSQANYSYYQPSKEEIEVLFEEDYDALDPSCQNLVAYLSKEVEEEQAVGIVHQLWNDLSYGLQKEGLLHRILISLNKEEDLTLKELVDQLDQSCRKFIYRGNRYIG